MKKSPFFLSILFNAIVLFSLGLCVPDFGVLHIIYYMTGAITGTLLIAWLLKES